MLLHATVIMSILIGLPVTWRAARAAHQDQDRFAVRPERTRRRRSPGWWLAAVTALLLLNQVLFTVYAVRVRHGDMSYLQRYVPDGWFVLADGPIMTWLAGHTPYPQLFAVCALRIPALLELPFGMLAYLTVLAWLNPGLCRRLLSVPVLTLTAMSYSITFGLIEWALHTPYTNQNLALRAVSAVLTVLALRRLQVPAGRAPRTAVDLLAFAASTAALGFLILALYDSVLLYSLGKLGDHWLGITLSTAALTAARLTARHTRLTAGRLTAGRLTGARLTGARLTGTRLTGTRLTAAPPPGPGLDLLVTGLSWWAALFLVPALAIRYELGFGSRLLAAGAGLLIIVVATATALHEVHARVPAGDTPRWLLGLAVTAVTAGIAATPALAVRNAHSEMALLLAAGLFAATATLVCVAWDRGSWFRPLRPSTDI
ncbi:hypothetical protein BJY16_001417 [Actinoplanes octamycinicus]|uniref:Uncharacterized protein n=1 Tax=Actinoplanes octamycinicus TaxID=135948 RepID=A0A7W7M5Q4_9ACTN|nr:pentapeptide repeat-containing protein [Actinoplanes octamycinicus]MBB4737958.1 hypothetical protein [Actinoplanes octamycinicus]GIE58991.1 hypothetical protein Aoc01nite_43930 [Actinoplanes octamycinicus]